MALTSRKMSSNQTRLSQSKFVSVAARTTTAGSMAQIGIAAVEQSLTQTTTPTTTMASALQQQSGAQHAAPASEQPRSHIPPRSELVFNPIWNYTTGN